MRALLADHRAGVVTVEAERQAEAEQAVRYRQEAAAVRAEAMERYPDSPTEAKELERTAADLISLASSIERRHRGIDPLPPAGLCPISPVPPSG